MATPVLLATAMMGTSLWANHDRIEMAPYRDRGLYISPSGWCGTPVGNDDAPAAAGRR